ncbi:hypothetical protein [Sphingomonas sp.]|uniref:hypothetical protein n=1 Tax=Sphingomonas sp. TaxID=28214 RepID=UPI003B3A2339
MGAPGVVRLAYADLSVADALAAEPVEGSGSAVPGSTLAALGRNPVDLLKPSPAQAKLAYLMLSMPLA